jgi:hypothetical protein
MKILFVLEFVMLELFSCNLGLLFYYRIKSVNKMRSGSREFSRCYLVQAVSRLHRVSHLVASMSGSTELNRT